MKEELASIAKSAAKSSAKIFFLSLVALVFGFVLNVIFLLFCIPEMQTITTQLGPIPAARAGGVGALIALFVILLALWPIVLLIVVFSLGFPIGYLLAAKKYAIGREISKLLSEHKDWFTNNVSHYIAELLKKKANSVKEGSARDFILRKLKDIPSLIKEQDSWPGPVQLFVQLILRSLHIQEVAEEISKKFSEKETEGLDFLEESVRTGLNHAIDKKLEPSSPILFYSLLAVNFLIFIGVKILY